MRGRKQIHGAYRSTTLHGGPICVHVSTYGNYTERSTDVDDVIVAEMLLSLLIEIWIWPALILLFTFMLRPPYWGVKFMVLVKGLRPLGSRAALEVLLSHQR
jgi:hypothetical protein